MNNDELAEHMRRVAIQNGGIAPVSIAQVDDPIAAGLRRLERQIGRPLKIAEESKREPVVSDEDVEKGLRKIKARTAAQLQQRQLDAQLIEEERRSRQGATS